MKVQLRKPFFPKSSIKTIQEEVKKTLINGRLTLGENVSSFESKFAKFLGVKYACAVSSGTAGLHLSLLSLEIKQGDEIIVPVKTFISTANAAIYCNAKPIFCDVDPDSFQLDPTKLKKLISKKTRAIIPVHLGGNICPMKEIKEIVEPKNIHIVEDAAHAHGSTYFGRKAGTFGTLGVFSFYPDKIMASSDGGIVVTNNVNLYNKTLSLRNVGRRFLKKYDFSTIGYNYRMNEIQAIIAKEQLKLLPKMIKRRREIAKVYDLYFSNNGNIRIQKIHSHVKSSYYAYILKLLKGNLSFLRSQLLKKGIETSLMFTTLYKFKPYQEILVKKRDSCRISEKLDDQTFTIPLHPSLNDKQVNYVGKTVINLINS